MYYLAEKDDFNTLLQNKLEFVAEFRKKNIIFARIFNDTNIDYG